MNYIRDMEKGDLEALAILIRDGKATEEQKLQFLNAINKELGNISDLLKKAPKSIDK